MNILHSHRLSWLALVLVLVAGFALPSWSQVADAQAEEVKTIGIVAAARYEKMIADISFLGSLAGKPEAGQMVEGMLTFLTQGKGVNALDKKQPWGLILQTDGAALLPVICLPVPKANDLLDIAKAYGAQVAETEAGLKEVQLPNQQTYFVKGQNNWLFISNSAHALDKAPQDPPASFGELVGDYNLAVRLSLKNMPESWRQLGTAWMEMGMQQGLQKRDDESDEQFAERQKLAEVQIEQLKRTLNEIDSITLGWAVDPAQQRTYLDLVYLFLPGSKMAEQVAAYGQSRTNFAGFYQPDAAATFTFSSKSDPQVIQQDIAQFETTMRTMREQLNKAIDENDDLANEPETRDALKAAAGEFLDAWAATIKAGEVDGGASLRVASDSLTFVAGLLVEQPGRIESGLKKIELAAQKKTNSKAPGIKWNAASHAGVTFHTLTVPVPEDQQAPRKVFGSELNVAVGIAEKAVYLALGRDYLDALKQAIDASAAEPQKAVPPFELAISLGPIMEMAAAQAEEGEQRELMQSLANLLRNEAPGRDHIRAVGLSIPNGLRCRFEAEEGVLRAIGKAAEEAQRQQLQANQ